MYTFGGYPEAEAWHWTTDTYQKFGTIVYQLSSNDAELRRKGYFAFYEFRNFFIEAEFLEMIDKLEEFRRNKHIALIGTLLKDIKSQIVSMGHINPAPATSVVMPLPAAVLMSQKPAVIAMVEGEQLSFL